MKKEPYRKKIIFGNNARKYRLALGKSQEQVAIAAEIAPQYLSKIENGKANLTIDLMEDISKELKKDLTLMLTEDKDNANS